MEHRNDPAARDDGELMRVSRDVAGRLAARGISLSGYERPHELAELEDAVEEFEAAVEERGGDLMVDEGPRGRTPEPDDSHFSLPRRAERESVSDYVERLARATSEVRRHPPRG